MAYLSEEAKKLNIEIYTINSENDLTSHFKDFAGVILLRLNTASDMLAKDDTLNAIQRAVKLLDDRSTIIILGETTDLVNLHGYLDSSLVYHHWIAIQRDEAIVDKNHESLPHGFFSALIYTKYDTSLKHIKTRSAYTYCPYCDRTTKDYGGKKHTYHEYGTLISDVWRDESYTPESNLDDLYTRFADLFGLDEYEILRVLDCRKLSQQHLQQEEGILIHIEMDTVENPLNSQLINGDCLDELSQLPSNSIDFVFIDPPYNLGKNYRGYADDLKIQQYFEWCDEWINEITRVLKPGRTLALLNIPLRAIRHFAYMNETLHFQNWIVWDALSHPVRRVMPAHYTILCFSKGNPRKLPGLIGQSSPTNAVSSPDTFTALEPLAQKFCVRPGCVKKRNRIGHNDRADLIDVWSDIHRIKHNSRRVDHPTQLPPHLMYRLLSIFTGQDEIILDCFNGSGTTTLTAQQLDRRYIGIEKSTEYYELALRRHNELDRGLDPWRKQERKKITKNNNVARMPKQKYAVSKKVLQLEVKRIAEELGHLPGREEVKALAKYPIKYYDDYFNGWGEVCAAARTTGMTETRDDDGDKPRQLKLL